MQLNLLPEEKGLSRAEVVGFISTLNLTPGEDPLESVLGPGGFSRKFLLNLEKATNIDSSGIGWLLICYKHFVQAGGQLILHSIPPLVMRTLKLVQLNKLIPNSVDEPSARTLAQGENQP